MSSDPREPKQKPEDELNFFVNYWNHYHAVKDKHQQLLNDVDDVVDLLKTVASIAATKINLFTPLRDGYDYLDEAMGVIVIPVVTAGLAVISFLLATLKMIHMLAIAVGIATEDKEQNPGQVALEGLVIGITLPLLAVASLVKCAISLITRPLSTLVQGVQEFDDDDEDRFLAVYSPTPFN